MYKKISITDARVGMFLVSTGLAWSENPFLSAKEGRLNLPDEIEKLRADGFREVIIDTERGLDVGDGLSNAASWEELAVKFIDGGEGNRSRQVSLAKELPKAQAAYAESLRFAENFIRNVRLGKDVRVEDSRPLMSSLMQSVTRNSDALLGLTKLRAADEYTYSHCINVSVLALVFGSYLGLSEHKMTALGMAALFHDLGKASLPDEVLNKPGKLTDEEFAVIKRHPEYSRQLLDGCTVMDSTSLEAVLHHHERLNGTGYPHGLAGEEVPIMAQVLGVVDVYDALTSRRVYKPAMPANKALGLIFGMREKDFISSILERFIKCLGIYPLGSVVRLDDGRIGIVCQSPDESPLRPTVRVLMDRKGYGLPPTDLNLDKHPARSIKECLDPKTVGIDPAEILLPQISKGR